MRNVKLKHLLPWLIAAVLAVPIVFVPLPVQAAMPTHRTIRMEAGSFAFSPAEVRVNQGDTVTIELVSTDVVHGVYVDGYDIQIVADPGQTSRLTFVAARPGVFRLRCSITCGALHPFMIGKLHVGLNALFFRAIGLAMLIIAATLIR